MGLKWLGPPLFQLLEMAHSFPCYQGGATSTGTSAPTVSAAASTTSAAKPEVEGFSLEELKTMSTLGQSFRSVAVSQRNKRTSKLGTQFFHFNGLGCRDFFDAWSWFPQYPITRSCNMKIRRSGASQVQDPGTSKTDFSHHHSFKGHCPYNHLVLLAEGVVGWRIVPKHGHRNIQ